MSFKNIKDKGKLYERLAFHEKQIKRLPIKLEIITSI